MEGGVEMESRRLEMFGDEELKRRCEDSEVEVKLAQDKEVCLVELEERRK